MSVGLTRQGLWQICGPCGLYAFRCGSLSLFERVVGTALPTRGVSFAMQHEGHNTTLFYISISRYLSCIVSVPIAPLPLWLKSNTEFILAVTRRGITGICTDCSGTILRGPLPDKRVHHNQPG